MCYGMKCLFESSYDGECMCDTLAIRDKYGYSACEIGGVVYSPEHEEYIKEHEEEFKNIQHEILNDKKLYY